MVNCNVVTSKDTVPRARYIVIGIHVPRSAVEKLRGIL